MQQVWDLFQTGGWVMYPLLALSVMSLTIFVERWRFYRRAQTNMSLIRCQFCAALHTGNVAKAKSTLDNAGGVVGSLMGDYLDARDTLVNHEAWLELHGQQVAANLKVRLPLLSAIVTIAPLMGLLGTVTGMIQAFDVLSVTEGQPFAITGGVAEALVATAFGLLIAIVAMAFHVILEQKATRLIEDVELAAGLLALHTGVKA